MCLIRLVWTAYRLRRTTLRQERWWRYLLVMGTRETLCEKNFGQKKFLNIINIVKNCIGWSHRGVRDVACSVGVFCAGESCLIMLAIFDFMTEEDWGEYKEKSSGYVGARTKEGKGGGEGAPSPSLWLTPHFLFNMALSRAKTFVHLKKTLALQAIRDDNVTIQFSYPTYICKIGSLKSLQCQFIAHADKQELGFINIQKFCFIIIFDGCLSFEHFVRNSVKDPKNNRRAEKKQARCPIYLYCSFSMSYTWLPIVPSLKNNVCRTSFSRELR